MLTIKPFSELTTLEFFEIAKLRIDVFVTEQKITAPELDETDKTAYHIFSTDQDGHVIATARFFKENGKFLIGRVVVAQEHRHEHLGAQVMSAIFTFLTTKQLATEVYVHAQDQAVGFYQKLGFLPVGAPFTEAGIEHQMMVKHL